VTKQFTAAAILKLHEQGKISLEDKLTKFIPDFPPRRTGDHPSSADPTPRGFTVTRTNRISSQRHRLV